jgi:hypothetical protein
MYNLNYTPTTLGVREQKRLNTTDVDGNHNKAFSFTQYDAEIHFNQSLVE